GHGLPAVGVLPVAGLDRGRAARPAEAAAAPAPRPAHAGGPKAPRLTLRWTRAVLHLPELQGALDRPRPARGAEPRRRRLPPLRVRVPLRAARGLLPGAGDRLRRLRPGGARACSRSRRLRALRLPRAGADGSRRGRGARALRLRRAEP